MTRSIRALPLFLAVAGCSLLARASERPADPVVSDGDKYQLVLENEQVRVLRYHDRPGDKTHLHHHPSFVLYAISPFKRRLTFADGTRRERAFAAGEVSFMPAQEHVGENIGAVPTDALLIELKGR